MTLEQLKEQIRTCRKCRLWQTACQAVPGEGPSISRVMLVGQNPGAEEDKTGRPFVGRTGKFLNQILAEHGINRQSIFITSIVKHATPKNRKPKPDEIEACKPYLVEQVELVKPSVVLLMGTVAWQTPRKEGILYIETYHPSAAMRFPKIRKKFLEDIQALSRYSGTSSEQRGA